MSGAFQVELPPSVAANEKLYSYLYQMAEQLNVALARMPDNKLTTEQTAKVTQIAGEALDKSQQSLAAQSMVLKSLIVKTADTIVIKRIKTSFCQ